MEPPPPEEPPPPAPRPVPPPLPPLASQVKPPPLPLPLPAAAPEPRRGGALRSRWVRVGVAVAVLVAVGVGVWLSARTRSKRPAEPAAENVVALPPLPLGFDDEAVAYLNGASASEVASWEADSARGEARGTYRMALCHGHAIHRAKNEETALQMLKTAAAAGVPEAQYTLASAYLNGKWTARDTETGRVWLREAANNVPRAAFELAQRYEGAGDIVASSGWYYRSAQLGHAPARKKIIEQIVADGIAPDNEDEILTWARDLVGKEPYAPAHYIAGVICADREQTDLALAALRVAAELKYAGAMFRLAQMYALGTGVPTDMAQSVAWLRKAADADDGRAQVLLAEVLHKGMYDQAVDLGAAANWIARAERSPSAETLYLLGNYYRDVQNDRTKAAAAMRKAADKGHGTAQTVLIELLGADEATRAEAMSLGQTLANQGLPEASVAYARLLLRYGTSPAHNAPAVAYLRPAANQGTPAAQYELAMLYLNGRGGVTADPVEATRWLMVVANNVEARSSHPTEWAAAVFQLAECYEKGRGVPQDAATANTLYEQAEKAGRPRPKANP